MKQYLRHPVFLILLMTLLLVTGGGSVAAHPGHEKIEQIEFNDATVGDAIKVLVDLTGVNIIVTKDASKEKVSLFLRSSSVQSVVASLCRVAGLWYRYDKKTEVFIVMTEEQYRKDVVVYREEETRIFVLKHQNVASAALAIEALFGSRVALTEPESDDSYKFDGDFGSGGGAGSKDKDNDNARQTGVTSGDDNTLSSNEVTLSQLANLGQGQDTRRLDESVLNLITQRAEPPIKVTFNYLHNLLLIRTSDEKAIEDIAEMIEAFDLPTRQVLLEMKILELTLGEDDRSIFDYARTSSATAVGPKSDSSGNPLASSDQSGIPKTAIGLGNFGLVGGTAVFQWMNANVLARVQLLQSENRVDVVSSPMLLSSNNKEATLFIGEERLMTVGVRSFGGFVSGDGTREPLYVEAETVIKQVGNLLTIWPRINDDRSVTLDIFQSNSTINVGAAKIPVTGAGGVVSDFPIDTIQTTNMELTAVAQEGRTIAVGGMIRKEIGESVEKVPLLGDLPVIGKLFRKTVERESRTELLLLITPHIFETAGEADKRSQQLIGELSKIPDVHEIWLDKETIKKEASKGDVLNK